MTFHFISLQVRPEKVARAKGNETIAAARDKVVEKITASRDKSVKERDRRIIDLTKTLAVVKREAADDEDDDSSSAAPRRKRRRRSSRATPRAPLRRPVPQDALIV